MELEKTVNEILAFIATKCPRAFYKGCIDVGGGPNSTWAKGFKELADFIMPGERNTIVLDIQNPITIHGTYIQTDLSDEIYKKAYTKSKYIKSFGGISLVICLEVAEHLEEKHAEKLIEYLTEFNTDYILFSAAYPNQPGEGHVNCQYPSYWADMFYKYSYYPYDFIRSKYWDSERYRYMPYWYLQNMILYGKAHVGRPDKDLWPNTPPFKNLDVIHPVLMEKVIEGIN